MSSNSLVADELPESATGAPQNSNALMVRGPRPARMFISYSHKDILFLEGLSSHLSILKLQGLIDEWNDRMIKPGCDWDAEIDERLVESDIILFLVSADFYSSRYCIGVEMKRAVELHCTGKTRIIPIKVRPVDGHCEPLSRFQWLPKGTLTVAESANQDAAFAGVTRGIREVIEDLRKNW